jgi:hypothetical protein
MRQRFVGTMLFTNASWTRTHGFRTRRRKDVLSPRMYHRIGFSSKKDAFLSFSTVRCARACTYVIVIWPCRYSRVVIEPHIGQLIHRRFDIQGRIRTLLLYFRFNHWSHYWLCTCAIQVRSGLNAYEGTICGAHILKLET